VDLRQLPKGLPTNLQLNFGCIANLHPSVYAIVETTELSPRVEVDVNWETVARLHAETDLSFG